MAVYHPESVEELVLGLELLFHQFTVLLDATFQHPHLGRELTGYYGNQNGTWLVTMVTMKTNLVVLAPPEQVADH